MVYNWARNNGMLNTVCTVFELVGGDNTTDQGYINYYIVSQILFYDACYENGLN